MCNEQARRVSIGLIREDWSQTKIPLRFPEGVPNLAPLDSIRITDRNAIIRRSPEAEGEAELVVRRWSWPGPTGKPVYNFRSEGREFVGGRCLIIADAFYEFTDSPPETDGDLPAVNKAGKRKKAKYRFTLADAERDGSWFCIAGLWRPHQEVGEAYTMLTCEPGPDIAPYHHRQVVTLTREDWGRWLDLKMSSADVLRPAAKGTFVAQRVA